MTRQRGSKAAATGPDHRRMRANAGARWLAFLSLGGLCAAPAWAGNFALGNGLEGNWSLNMSVGTSIRAQSADEDLIMVGNGGTANSSHDDGNLNFDKGDAFSTIARTVGELTLKKGDVGLFLRGKAWYDQTLEQGKVDQGSNANGFASGKPLDDHDFDTLSKFSGATLADAYLFWDTTLGNDMPLSVKLGSQVVNWGESLFIPGINQFGAFDLAAARRPGTEVKEILLPIPQISANLGVSDALSVEGFYQFQWKKSILDGCGTYWGIADLYNCDDAGAVVAAGPFVNQSDALNNTPSIAGQSAVMANGGNIEPDDGGQWGVAARYYASSLSTEFGAYYANYHQRTPTLSVLFDGSPPPSAFSGSVFPASFKLQYQWDWSAEDIKVLGLSFSTELGGWSVFGEISRSIGVPVQINGVDLLAGAASGRGPMAFLQSTPRDQGSLYTGYDRKNKTQFQVSTIKSFPRVMGAENMVLVGEIAFQHWNGIGDPATGRRYGRAFLFGQAETSTVSCAATGNANTDYCENEGFATENAWGYRMRAQWSYPNAFAGVNLKPRVYWQHDVEGYAADNLFVEDRQVLGLGVRADYLNKYYADFSYNRFNDGAKYDIFHDRDYYSIVVGASF